MTMLSIGEFARRSRLSPKALRLYDELGILRPARVDPDTGYRWYEPDQLERARLVAVMRQVDLPLHLVRQVLAAEAPDAVVLVRSYWQRADTEHRLRGELTAYLLGRLEGRSPIIYEVTTRSMPERTVLFMKRHVASEREVWDLAEQFLSYFREQPTPLLEGRRGAPFLVYHGEVSADSDGPVEFCRPIPGADSEATAARYPDLELRIEPAHEEAVVLLGTDRREGTPWPVVVESLFSWASEHGREPSDLGLRLTYLFVLPLTRESVPDIDLAVPLARA